MDIKAAELAIIARIKAQTTAQTKAFPEDPAQFIPMAPVLEHLVRYAGSVWEEPAPNRENVLIQEARHEFVVVSVYRHLTGHGGMYEHLLALQAAVTGYTLPGIAQATPFRPVRRGFIREGNGMWWYETVFAMTCPEAEA